MGQPRGVLVDGFHCVQPILQAIRSNREELRKTAPILHDHDIGICGREFSERVRVLNSRVALVTCR